jgi:hypothetical protein
MSAKCLSAACFGGQDAAVTSQSGSVPSVRINGEAPLTAWVSALTFVSIATCWDLGVPKLGNHGPKLIQPERMKVD